MKKLFLCILSLFLIVSCENSRTQPIEKYRGKGIIVILPPQGNSYRDNDIRCKTKDSVFWIVLTNYDALNLKVGDTL